ncbi:hypothetical protein HC256_005090 [Beauveria bassiana]|nr:hypothetical protein HC256_005090 [Beauveria bassiana]
METPDSRRSASETTTNGSIDDSGMNCFHSGTPQALYSRFLDFSVCRATYTLLRVAIGPGDEQGLDGVAAAVKRLHVQLHGQAHGDVDTERDERDRQVPGHTSGVDRGEDMGGGVDEGREGLVDNGAAMRLPTWR